MYADDVGAFQDRGGDGGHGAMQAIFGRSGCAVVIGENAADVIRGRSLPRAVI